MKLKDILELGTYGYTQTVRLKYFEKRLENEGFHVILLPSDENTTIHPYGFLIEDAILIAMVDEEDDDGS